MDTAALHGVPALAEYLTVNQVASRLRIDRATVWRQVERGVLPDPVYVSDRSPRWIMAEIEAALLARRQSPKVAMAARRRRSINRNAVASTS